MFSITADAIKQIKTAIEQSDAKGLALRIKASFGEDRNLKYMMGFDEQQSNEASIDIKGVTVLIDPNSTELLDEATLDFVKLDDGDMQFVFVNPLDPNYVPPKKDSSAN